MLKIEVKDQVSFVKKDTTREVVIVIKVEDIANSLCQNFILN